MKCLLIIFLAMVCWTSNRLQFAEINYVDSYYRSNGTYVSGHYKDTSADGNPYNNAKYLGY